MARIPLTNLIKLETDRINPKQEHQADPGTQGDLGVATADGSGSWCPQRYCHSYSKLIYHILCLFVT